MCVLREGFRHLSLGVGVEVGGWGRLLFHVLKLVHTYFFFNKFIYLFIYFWPHWVFVAACGLFSSCGEWGLLFVAVRRLLIAVASLVAECGL